MIPEVKENDLVICGWPGDVDTRNCERIFKAQWYPNTNKWKETCGNQHANWLRYLRKKEKENRVMVTTYPMRLNAPRLLIYGIAILFLLALAFPLFGQGTGNIKITWDTNTESDLAGYKVHIGEKSVANGDSSTYKVVVDKTNTVIGFEWKSLELGKTYYMAVTAYDFSGNESGYSNEVSHFFELPKDTDPPGAPKNSVIVEVSVTVKVQN